MKTVAASEMQETASQGKAAKVTKRKNSTKAYIILGVLAVLAVAGYFGYGIYSSAVVSTDNGQIEADVIPIAARVGGMVTRIAVQDNQVVKKGDLVAEIDTIDYETRIEEAEAELEAAKAQAEQAPHGSVKANVAQVLSARAALARTSADLQKRESDLARARTLTKEKAITPVELENAQNAEEQARAARDQASAQLKVAEQQHDVSEAKVKTMQAKLDMAKTQLGYTKIYALHDGTLSRLAMHEGQLIQPGQMITQMIDADSYVVANFKETQIGKMRPGQRAEIEVDAYPGKKFEGTVESLAAATGARFSLIPPDNASGNFVKVVQRVPIKIKLENAKIGDVALKAGLSADVTVFVK